MSEENNTVTEQQSRQFDAPVMCELPMIIKRALVYGIRIYPHQLKTVLREYDSHKIPDETLSKLKSDEVEKYVHALYLCGQDMAGDWTKGHKLLKELGFKKQERSEGHRTFVKMVYA